MSDGSHPSGAGPEIESELAQSGDPDADSLTQLATAIQRIRAQSGQDFDREAIWAAVERHLDDPDSPTRES